MRGGKGRWEGADLDAALEVCGPHADARSSRQGEDCNARDASERSSQDKSVDSCAAERGWRMSGLEGASQQGWRACHRLCRQCQIFSVCVSLPNSLLASRRNQHPAGSTKVEQTDQRRAAQRGVLACRAVPSCCPGVCDVDACPERRISSPPYQPALSRAA